MIPGLRTARVVNPQSDVIEVLVTTDDPQDDSAWAADTIQWTVLLFVGPPDPTTLTDRLDQSVFERGVALHVSALDVFGDIGDSIVDIIELMNPNEIAVFLCQNQATLHAACEVLDIEC